MLAQLLDSLYRALDKNPNPVIAFRASHPDGFAWRVKNRSLEVKTEAGDSLGVLNLRGLTVRAVTEQLSGLGCNVVYLNGDVADCAADALLSGAGIESKSNGNALSVYGSLLWSVIDSYAVELEGASAQVIEGVNQIDLNLADGEFLDLWGRLFGIDREIGMDDSRYRKWIIDETLRPRSNRIAIEKAINELTGDNVILHEPWMDMFVLGESRLNGKDHFQDGSYYTRNVIHPLSSDVSVDWVKALRVIERNRPAGTVIVSPAWLKPAVHAVRVSFDEQSWSGESLRVAQAYPATFGVLGMLTLSSCQVPKNYFLTAYQIKAHSNEGVLGVYAEIDPCPVAKASVCLSDGARLGDPNCILNKSRTWVDYFGSMSLSGSSDDAGYVLGGVFAERFTVPVDEVVVDYRSATSSVGSSGYAVDFAANYQRGLYGRPDDAYSLGRLPLSAGYVTRNHHAAVESLVTVFSSIGVSTGWIPVDVLTRALASIPLSDGLPIGDPNSALGGGRFGVPYDAYRIDDAGYLVSADLSVSVSDARSDDSVVSSHRLSPDGLWVGLWDGRTWAYPSASMLMTEEFA